MRTTLRIDDKLYRAVKKRAAEEGRTMTQIFEDGLRLALKTPAPTPFKLQLRAKRGATAG